MLILKILFIITLCSFRLISQESWSNKYGGTEVDYLRSVRQTSDGGYIAAGYTSSHGAGLNDVWLVKTDAFGTVTWDKTYGNSRHDFGYSVIQCADNGFVAVGTAYITDTISNDVWLIKTDRNGTLVWDKSFSNAGYNYGNAVQQTSDGGYIITGCKGVADSGDLYGLLIKTNSAGDQTWKKSFAGYGYDVRQTIDGGYVISGARGRTILLCKTNSSGDTLWSKTFGASNASQADVGYAVQQTADGGYIIGGYKIPAVNQYNKSDFWLIKTDPVGTLEWDTVFGQSWASHDYGYSMQQTNDGGYIITGHTQSSNVSTGNCWLIKTDSDGHYIWDRNLYALTTGFSVRQTGDGGYIIAGFASGDTITGVEGVIVKTDSDGNVDIQYNPEFKKSKPVIHNLVSINRLHSTLKITLNTPLNNETRIAIYSINGTLLAAIIPKTTPVFWNYTNISSGTVFVTITTSGNTYNSAITLIHY